MPPATHSLSLLMVCLLAACGEPQESEPKGSESKDATPPSRELSFVRRELASPAGERSGMPHLAEGPGGELYLSWLEELDGPSAQLVFSKLGPAGWGPSLPIASGEDWFNNWADRPSLESLGAGALVAHWLQRLGSGTYAYGVRFSISRNEGADWDEPRWLHTDQQPVEHGFASFAALDRDTIAALWLDGRATGKPAEEGSGFEKGPMALYFRTIELDGELGQEQCIDSAVCDCCPTALSSLGEGQLALAYRGRTPEEERDVLLATYVEGAWGPTEVVDEEAWVIPGCPVNGPSLSTLGENLGLAWYTGAGEESRVLASFGGPEGVYPSRQVDLGAPEGRSDLVLWDAERLLVSWMEHTSEGPAWMLRSLSREGQLGMPEVLARVPGKRASGYGRLARTGGDLVFAWTDSVSERVLTCRLEASR